MNNKSALIKNLQKHIFKKPVSFHTPGHKNGTIIPPLLKKYWPQGIWQYDLTEISDLDNLHNPVGCIQEAQKRAALVFKAKESFFLVNGTSVGLQGALLGLSHQKPIFVPRHVHKSIYNGIFLADAKPIFLPVAIDEKLGIPLGVEPEVLEEYIHNYPDCKNIILPNPTYQGFSYKIRESIDIAKKNGLQVILDEAHGSHFSFHTSWPPAGLELGADIVVQSWHKTLPVLTQASVLHVSKDYQGPDLAIFINMLQTTSPSYLLLASLDAARALMESRGTDLLTETLDKINGFKKEIMNLKTIKILFNEPQDPLKLCLYSNRLDGFQLAKMLAEKFGIYVELAEENYCLLIWGISINEETIDILKKALTDIDKISSNLLLRKNNFKYKVTKMPQCLLSFKEALFKDKEVVSLAEVDGRIAGDFIVKYPPGIPLFVPGEKIDKKILESTNFSNSSILVVKE